MNEAKMRQLLRQEEGPKLDFKAMLHLETESEKKELVKDVIAIANTRGGRGHIVYGVEDKTKCMLGMQPENFTEEQIQQIIYNRSDPPVAVQVEFLSLDGFLLMSITIFRSQHRPHQMLQTGAFYVRRGSTTDVARRDELAGMLQENGLFSFETVPVPGATMDDLMPEKISAYVYPSPKKDLPAPSMSLLEALGFVSDVGNSRYVPTIGAILLFGKRPEIFFPQHHIRLVCGEWVEVVYGCVPDMMDKAMHLARQMINNENWPMEALEEALSNAILHRDYLDNGRGIDINITPKTVEVCNPGALKDGNSMVRHHNAAYPVRRNPWLYQRLMGVDRMHRFQRTKKGTKRIMHELEKYGSVRFVNLGEENLFKVLMPGPGYT